MNKHTPGPWVYKRHFPADNLYITQRHENKSICVINMSENDEANARLIAAAPELLEACRQSQYALLQGNHELNDNMKKALKTIKQAIAKAEEK